MGRHPTFNRKYSITHMWERQHEIKRRLVIGQSNLEIAQALGITPQTVSITRNSPIVMEQIKLLRDRRDDNAVDIASELNQLVPSAMAILKKVVDPNNEEVHFSYKWKAVEKILSPGGFVRPPNKIQGEFIHGHLTSEDIEEIKERARRAKEDGVVIDVECEEEKAAALATTACQNERQ